MWERSQWLQWNKLKINDKNFVISEWLKIEVFDFSEMNYNDQEVKMFMHSNSDRGVCRDFVERCSNIFRRY